MFPLHVLVLLIHAAYPTTACQDGVEIVTKETKNPQDLIGNWTYVYHWDNLNKFEYEFVNDGADHEMRCPEISIEAITPEYLKAKKTECGDSPVPFDWADAKLKLVAPLMKMKAGVLVIGDRDNWIMMECKRMVRVVMKKVSEDYIVLINPDMAHVSEMIAKRTPAIDELKWIAHNVDVGKGMSGFGLCG